MWIAWLKGPLDQRSGLIALANLWIGPAVAP